MICQKFALLCLKSTGWAVNRSTAAKLGKRFSLTDRTFKKNAKASRDGTMMNSEGCRPPTIDDNSYISIRDGSGKELKLDTPDFLKLMNKEAWKIYLSVTAPCRQTLFRTEKRLCIGSGIAEETINARAVATRSIWNAVSFAAMNIAIIPLVNVHLICNLDATQFAVGDSKGARVEVKYCNDDSRPQSLNTVTKGDNIVSYFIKYFLLIFADGSTGPPVYVVADGSMDGNAIDAYGFPALGISTELHSVGYVVFCKSRCCNINFFSG